MHDDFFTFTEADYHVVVSGYAARAKQQSEPLKTKAMRDAEAAARAAAFPVVRVRVQLPDGHIVQSEFAASQPLSAVRARLTPLLACSDPWHLYTAPPKKVLDETLSLYALQLVPAALLYVGCDAGQQHWVREDALRAYGGLPALATPTELAQSPKASTTQIEESNSKPPAPRDDGRKVPKWMKL